MMKKLWHFLFRYRLFSLAIVALIVGLVFYFTKHHGIAYWVLGVIASLEVLPLLWGMWEDLRTGKYGIDILAATAIVSSVLFKQYWAGIVIVLMLTGGESLENYAERRASTELNALLSSSPQTAHLVRGNKVVDVAASEVRLGNKIVIRPGEVVPVDAVIIDGITSLDESSLTGESLPQEKKIGSDILSGSVNLDGVITARALRPAAESQYEQIIKLVRSASNSRAPFVRLADRYAIPFTLVSFAIAIGAWIISGQSIRFLEVLVVATPCPLILAAPIAVISGMSRAAKHGIIAKTGSSLEILAEVKTIGFDKTGTLTEGVPEIKKIRIFNDLSEDHLISYAASVEQESNHILGMAIVKEAQRRKIKLPKAKKVSEISGQGLNANVKSKDILIGRLSLMQERGIEMPKDRAALKVEDTATYVAIDGKLTSIITFEDRIRPESKKTLTLLRQYGVKDILMVTGDNSQKAQAIAKSLGIKNVVAEALPVDKIRAIESVENKPVAFVGDGVNDAPVLASSDVGIALGARGKTAASESADMVILLDDITQVAKAREIAKRTFSIAQQSIVVGILLSVTLMIIFSSGHFRAVYGAILQEIVDVIVIFNALRAHGAWKKPTVKKKLSLKPA